MTYVITENCIKCKYTDCVEVCPVDCFHEGPNFLVINPEECIDCSLCEPECPINAILSEDDLKEEDKKYLELNTTGGAGTASTPFNNTEPTSSVWTVGTAGGTNTSGATYIAYCFHSVSGYSKVGSYTGNGSSDGTFVYTGFRPAWIMIKRTDVADDWEIQNTKTSPYNVSKTYIFANEPDPENTSGAERIDFVSNGFKTRVNASTFNASGGEYIYIAFAETPFKYATSR